MLFVVMMSRPDNDSDDDINTENENTVLTSSTQTLDLLALHLPPEKLLPHLVSFKFINITVTLEIFESTWLIIYKFFISFKIINIKL